jgi:TolB-like protein
MNELLTFDRFRFDPVNAQLWDDEVREIKLTRKAAAVLALLIGRAGLLVTKKDLFTRVWANTIVTDDALTTCVQEIRKALADDARQPRFIETRHGVGYQFIAAVSRPTDLHESSFDPKAIAVLPFVDMSPDEDQDHFCEGLAEELIDALTQIDGLRVAARTASFQFRGDADIRDVGRRLGVGSLLEGSVRKAGDRLRVTVQLIDVSSGYHKWSRRFDCALGDVFAIQDAIAGGRRQSTQRVPFLKPLISGASDTSFAHITRYSLGPKST